MNQRGFSHKGRVVALEQGGIVKVSLTRAAACDGCHAKGKCSVSGGEGEQERVMSVEVGSDRGRGAELSVGDSVEVSITYRVGVIAIVVAYVTPLIIFIATIIAAVSLGLDEGLSAAVAFVVAAIYYGVVYLCRGRFERVVNFEVNKL